ncbi:cell division protein PerM [Subtercola sp. YIM 133946]|uniref:cell division protein PerM n=1 Tax=Subtercola sp. YIM 133946 TaxID=3118909 RepID=UPI002F948F80
MNRPTTALLAALDALLSVAIGLGIPLVMLTILWAVQFDLAVDWTSFWRAAADFWMLGNGVDLLVSIDPQTAAQLGLEQAAVPFEIGIAPLGFALLTVLLGRRSGLRLGQSPHPVLGTVTGVLTVGVLAALIWSTAQSATAVPSLRQAVVLLPLLYGVGAVIGAWSTLLRLHAPLAEWVLDQTDRLSDEVRTLAAVALRGGAIMAAAMVAAGALAVSLLLVIHYSTVISLYESLQSGIAGGAALTLGQIAVMPNLAIWAASWLLGPGFALGTGSSVSPLGTQLGLIPSLPVFGALPQGSPLGFVALIVPVVVGLVVAAVLRGRLPSPAAFSLREAGRMLGTGVGMGVVAATILSLLAMWSGGALGPGRLADVGPDPGAVFLWALVIFGVTATIGLLANGMRGRGGVTGAPRDADARGTAARDKAARDKLTVDKPSRGTAAPEAPADPAPPADGSQEKATSPR